MGVTPVAHVFLNYSHEDEDYVEKLAAAVQQHGIEVWRDSAIDYGEDWPDVIENHLDHSAAVVLVMSVDSKKSRWVKNEMTRAIEKNIPMVPVLLSGDKWLQLQTTQFADVRDGKLPPNDFFEQLAVLSTSSGDLPDSPQRASLVEPQQLVDAITPSSGGDRREALVRRIEAEVGQLTTGPETSVTFVRTQGTGEWSTTVRRPMTIGRSPPGFEASAWHKGGRPKRDPSLQAQLRRSGWKRSRSGPSFKRPSSGGHAIASDVAKAVTELHIAVGDDLDTVVVTTLDPSSYLGRSF